MRSLGVDRLTLGIQSLDPRDRSRLFGRVHDADQSFAAFRAARAAGFARLSVDLIYAVPGQELSAWIEHLARVLDLRPDHVSAYALAFESGTLMSAWMEDGRLEPLPEGLDLAFFQATRDLLVERGYEAYETSNFALSGQRCRHNELYWRNEPYVGIGPSAVSRVDRARFGNPRSVGAWRQAVEAGRFPASWEEVLTPVERLGESWWLGLRTADGVDPERARAGAGLDAADDPTEGIAAGLAGHGLLERTGGRWRLTERGRPLADAVARRFLEGCGAAREASGRPAPASGAR